MSWPFFVCNEIFGLQVALQIAQANLAPIVALLSSSQLQRLITMLV